MYVGWASRFLVAILVCSSSGVLACFQDVRSDCSGFPFEGGKVYTYDYKGVVNSAHNNSDHPHTSVTISCTGVKIIKINDCGLKLESPNCELSGSSERSAQFKTLMSKPVLVQVKGDKPYDVVSTAGDTALDLKKAILSAFFAGDDGESQMTCGCKKAARKCSREGINKVTCHQRFNRGANWFERTKDYSMAVKIEQTLTKTSIAAATPNDESTAAVCTGSEVKSLMSDLSYEPPKKAVQEMTSPIPPPLPTVKYLISFAKFVDNMNKVELEALRKYIHDWWNCVQMDKCTAEQKDLVRSSLIDRLVACDSVACKVVYLELAAQDKITGSRVMFFMYDILARKDVSKEMIKPIYYTCMKTKTQRCWLLFSGIVHRVYAEKGSELEGDSDTKELIQGNLGKALNGEENSQMLKQMTAIKFAGNLKNVMEYLDSAIVEKLGELIKHSDKAIASAAILSVAKIPASGSIKASLLEILADESKSDVIRIRAYQAFLRKVSKPDVLKLIDILQKIQSKHCNYYIHRHLSHVAYETKEHERLQKILLEVLKEKDFKLNSDQFERSGGLSMPFHLAKMMDLPYLHKRKMHFKGSVLYETGRDSPSAIDITTHYNTGSEEKMQKFVDVVMDWEGSMSSFMSKAKVSGMLKNAYRKTINAEWLGEQIVNSIMELDKLFSDSSPNAFRMCMSVHGYDLMYYDSREKTVAAKSKGPSGFQIAKFILNGYNANFAKSMKLYDYDSLTMTTIGVPMKDMMRAYAGYVINVKFVAKALQFIFGGGRALNFKLTEGGAAGTYTKLKLYIAGVGKTSVSGFYAMQNRANVTGEIKVSQKMDDVKLTINNPGKQMVYHYNTIRTAKGGSESGENVLVGDGSYCSKYGTKWGYKWCFEKMSSSNSSFHNVTKNVFLEPLESINAYKFTYKFPALTKEDAMKKSAKRKLNLAYVLEEGGENVDYLTVEAKATNDRKDIEAEVEIPKYDNAEFKLKLKRENNADDYSHNLTISYKDDNVEYFKLTYDRKKMKPPMNFHYVAQRMTFFPVFSKFNMSVPGMFLAYDVKTQHALGAAMETKIEYDYYCTYTKLAVYQIHAKPEEAPSRGHHTNGTFKLLLEKFDNRAQADLKLDYPGNKVRYNAIRQGIDTKKENFSITVEWTSKKLNKQKKCGIKGDMNRHDSGMKDFTIFMYGPYTGWEVKGNATGSFRGCGMQKQCPNVVLDAKKFQKGTRPSSGKAPVSRKDTFDPETMPEELDEKLYAVTVDTKVKSQMVSNNDWTPTGTTMDMEFIDIREQPADFQHDEVLAAYMSDDEGQQQKFSSAVNKHHPEFPEAFVRLSMNAHSGGQRIQRVRYGIMRDSIRRTFFYSNDMPGLFFKYDGYLTYNFLKEGKKIEEETTIHFMQKKIESKGSLGRKRLDHTFTSPLFNHVLNISQERMSGKPRVFTINIESKSPLNFLNYNYDVKLSSKMGKHHFDENITHPYMNMKCKSLMTKTVINSNATFSNILGLDTPVDLKLNWVANSFDLNATFIDKDLLVRIKTDSSNPKRRSITFGHEYGDGEFIIDMVAYIETMGNGRFKTKFTSTPEGKENMKKAIKRYGLISLIWHKKVWNDLEEYAWGAKTDVDEMNIVEFINHMKTESWAKMKDNYKCLEYKMCRRQARKSFERLAAATKRVKSWREKDFNIEDFFKAQRSQAIGGFMKYVMRSSPNSDSSLESDITIPVTMRSFENSPKLQTRQDAIYKRLKNYFSSWSRNDLKSSARGSSALIFGMGFVYTFDGRIYNHPGYNSEKCTYLLARDVLSKDFYLISTKQTITLVTFKNSYAFNHNNEVMIDGNEAKTPLPYTSPSGSIKIYSKGPYLFMNISSAGHIMCDRHNFLCYVSVNEGYSHGIRGLFGTNDGDFSNEFMKMDNKVVNSVSDFVNAYELSKEDACQHTEKTMPDGEPNQYCATLFDNADSSFAGCFETVDKTPFFNACQDTTKGSENDAETICKIGSAYVAACRYKGVHLKHDKSCGKCGDKKISEKWTPAIEKLADVVLVVSQHENNNLGKDAKEYLKNLIADIDEQLSEKGFSNTKFGVVGFGGSGYRATPMQFTSRANEAFGTPREMNDAINNLQFNVQTTLARDFALEAVKMASKNPFRPNAARCVILITPFEDLSGYARNDILPHLRNSSIIFNSVSRYASLERDNVDGMNWNMKIISDNDELNGSDGGYFPTGVYANYAKHTDGAIFDISKLWKMDNKDVIESLSERVAEQLAGQPGTCRECECHQGKAGQGVTRCKPINCA